jgi:hypothetical protein
MLDTMPRLTASSASSRAVQCVTGRPHSSGLFWQARATIWQSCSGVNVAGAPLRSRSSSNSVSFCVHTDSSQSEPLASHSG